VICSSFVHRQIVASGGGGTGTHDNDCSNSAPLQVVETIAYRYGNERFPDLVPGSAKTERLQIWLTWLYTWLRNTVGVCIHEETHPTISNRLAMTVDINDTTGESRVARQILFPSAHNKWLESEFIKDLAKAFGSSLKEANRFLGEIGIATVFDAKTGYRILSFIQEAWNSKSPRLGRNGTTTAKAVKEQDIVALDDLIEHAPAYRPLLGLVLNGTAAAPTQAVLAVKLEVKDTVAVNKVGKRKRTSDEVSTEFTPESVRPHKLQSPLPLEWPFPDQSRDRIPAAVLPELQFVEQLWALFEDCSGH